MYVLLTFLTLGAHAQRGLQYLVCVCMFVFVSICLSVCPSDTLFLGHSNLTHWKKIPMALAQHCPNCSKKGFHDTHFIQKLWHHFLACKILRGFGSIQQSLLRVLKRLNNKLNATCTCHRIRCKSAGFFLFMCFSLYLALKSLLHTFSYT